MIKAAMSHAPSSAASASSASTTASAPPGQHHEKTRRKHARRVRDAERQQWDQQIRRLRDEIRHAIVGGREVLGVKPHHEEHEDF